MENSNYKNENIETKYLKDMRKNQSLKVKSSILELETDFTELKNRELKNRETEEPFLKPIIVSLDDMDKFEQKEMKELMPVKNIWYVWLINCIPDPIRKV